MHTYEDAKMMLHKELAEIVNKGELSAGSLETIDKLLNSIKNACKILMYEEYSDDEYSQANGQGMGGSYRGGNSYANQRRDSRGRYSREGGYSMARGGRGGSRGGRGGYSRDGGYSYDDGKEEKVEILREMMEEASSEDERRVIQKLIRRMENE